MNWLPSLLLLVCASIGAVSYNTECALIVPSNPLSAQGLATPYLLTTTSPQNGPCNMSNNNQQIFVQGAIVDLDLGRLLIYNPLVIDQGSQPAVNPTPPTLPARSVVALWFGTNADVFYLLPSAATTTQRDSLQQGNCVQGVLDGDEEDAFGQFAYCNAPNFYSSVRNLIEQNKIIVPPLGVAADGQPCVTLRNFAIVDADQSDAVVTTYLLNNDGTTAQNTELNRLLFPHAAVIDNDSDNRLLADHIAPALGCTPWQVPDIADGSRLDSAVPYDELHALYNQPLPMAQIPSSGLMVITNGVANILKLNAYRVGVAQTAVSQLVSGGDGDPLLYCQALATIGSQRFISMKPYLVAASSPDLTVATNLFTFLVHRYTDGFNDLNCPSRLGIPNPIRPIYDLNNICVDATITPLNLLSSSAYGTQAPVTPTVIGLSVGLSVTGLISIILSLVLLCSRKSSPRRSVVSAVQHEPSTTKEEHAQISNFV